VNSMDSIRCALARRVYAAGSMQKDPGERTASDRRHDRGVRVPLSSERNSSVCGGPQLIGLGDLSDVDGVSPERMPLGVRSFGMPHANGDGVKETPDTRPLLPAVLGSATAYLGTEAAYPLAVLP